MLLRSLPFLSRQLRSSGQSLAVYRHIDMMDWGHSVASMTPSPFPSNLAAIAIAAEDQGWVASMLDLVWSAGGPGIHSLPCHYALP